MDINQKIAISGLVVILFLGVFGPRIYFDFRVDRCLQAEANQEKAYGNTKNKRELAIIKNICTMRAIGAAR